MPHITDRDHDNSTRAKRLAQLRRGPGVFMYDGSLEKVHHTPTPLRTGKKEIMLDSEGFPVTDSAGRAAYKPAGQIVTDIAGRPVLGGVPKVERIKRETVTVRGTEFPQGQPVAVRDASLALKLRGMPGFEEVSEGESNEAEAPEAAPARRRSRSRKIEAEAPEG